MRYLVGEQIDKAKLSQYIGKRVIFLRERDIDKSGRGYFFPRTGVLTFASKSLVDFDDSREMIRISNLREIVLATPENIVSNFSTKPW